MGLTARLMEQRSQVTTLKDPAKWLVDWWGGGATSSGVTVTPNKARSITAVWCAVRIIAESIAASPLFIYKRRPDGKGRDKQINNPLHRLLHDQPNPWQTSFEWLEMMTGHACLRGNAYSEIVYDGRGGIKMLVPRHPDRIRVYDITGAGIGDQVLAYEYHPVSGPPRMLFADEVLHLKGLSDDGLVGLSVIDEFREVLGIGIATEQYAGRFFANYGNPGGVLTHPKSLTEGAALRLQQQWQAKHTGVENAHKVAVLEEGLTWTAIGVKPQDSQLLESRKFSVTEFARILRVPPHKLYELDRSTNNNIEHQSIEFVTDTLRPWAVRWEKRLAVSLLTSKERNDGYYIEFNLDGMLRGDIQTRFRAYAMGRQWGIFSPNDVLAKENMNPREDPGGDAYHEPLNMQSSKDPVEDDTKQAADKLNEEVNT